MVSLDQTTETGCTVFLTVGKDSCKYAIDRIPDDDGAGFEVTRDDPARRVIHHVHVGGEFTTCDCTAGLLGKVKCKHVLAVAQMMMEGHL